ncbi:hypothetical protein [Roseimicrobium sp. ORNL1]|uniref:hypothetical protein n=1 Tax=Roseimicrobium sp. ORNL1 TaxID=2711231 RepID=UPI0013E0FDC0|nr:hypothetical protein [Roseimicrobium sp. ORNL1]QIF01898.1 hypothetical protein G5S37_10285 [Roseimicrobium sp. ORNL1]
MKLCNRWVRFCAAVALAAVSFCEGVAPAQELPHGPPIPQPDLTSAQLDWVPKSQDYWPKKAWNRDPWWSTARALVRPALHDDMRCEPENKVHPGLGDTWNRRLLKVLMPQVTQVTPTSAYITGSGSSYAELTMAKFQGALPFEIRQSIWVWTFWFPKDITGLSPNVEKVRALLPEAFRTKFVPVTEQSFPAETLRLSDDSQPPYFRDMLLFETKSGVILCGGKIMGPIAMLPSHQDRYWFTHPRQQQRMSKTR